MIRFPFIGKIIFALFILLLSGGYSQSHFEDSLKTLIKNASHDTMKLSLYGDLIRGIPDPNVWIKYVDEAIYIAEKESESTTGEEKKSFQIYLSISYDAKATAYMDLGNPKKAYEFAEKEMTTSRLVGYKTGIARSYTALSSIQEMEGKLEAAIMNLNKALKIFEEINDYQGTASALNHLGKLYQWTGQDEKVITHLKKSYDLSSAHGDKESQGEALLNLGVFYSNKGKNKEALDCFLRSVPFCERSGNKIALGNALGSIAFINFKQGNIPVALDYYHRSLRVREADKDQAGIGKSLVDISAVYKSQGEWKKAMTNLEEALKIFEKLNHKTGLGLALINLSSLYQSEGNCEKAHECSMRSLKVREEAGEEDGIAYSLNFVGVTSKCMGDTQQAISYFEKSLEKMRFLGIKAGECAVLYHLGLAHFEIRNNKKAFEYAESSLHIAEELGFPESIVKSAQLIYRLCKKSGRSEEALKMHELYTKMSDSITNQENRKASIKKQYEYEYEKKEAQVKANAKVEKDKLELKAAEDKKRQNLIIYTVFGGLLLVSGFSVFIFRSLQKNKEANRVISAQKKEVEHQKQIVDEKQKEILDSIRYAKRIQSALITNEKYIQKSISKWN